ncbi:GTP-binding protein [Candidatus Synechococcus calcipolaris G9]|uniref:GTP-binding protein n=1 Tax=Candidatus Synechococcus calcipolaris G9 TaxID=1497997 RepID=A0ABT6EXZ6_9SYNE|nr:GTP-binding protein [Candidatus Synechococcus calcipolaris]MDG2990687.1 GTP-binding protein [Candidatus Synechococcus calcipolaris G9]
MNPHNITLIAGPPGVGKTAWISQLLQDKTRPMFYLCPGMGEVSVDLARMGYQFPWVSLLSEDQAPRVLANLPDQAQVYLEVGFHLNLETPFFTTLPCHRVAVLPPSLEQSEWHHWADDVIPGNDIGVPDLGQSQQLPELWRSLLTGQVLDPPSLDEILIELTGGAYGQIMRLKGIFELPDGRAFYVDFVEGLSGIEYGDLNLPPWRQGRPNRFSGLEVIGYNLERDIIAKTLLEACLAEDVLAQYQEQYQMLHPQGKDTEEVISP